MQIEDIQIDSKVLLKLLISTFVYLLIEFLILFFKKKTEKKEG